MLPPLLPCYSLDYLGWLFSSFHPSLARLPHGVYNYFAVSCASSPLLRPPRSYPRSRSRYPRPRSHLRHCPRFRPRPRPVPAPVPVPILRSFVCVTIAFILDVRHVDASAGVTQEDTQDFSTSLLRCLPYSLSRKGFSHPFLSSTVKSNSVYPRINRSPLVVHFLFFFCEKQFQFVCFFFFVRNNSSSCDCAEIRTHVPTSEGSR